MCSSVAARAASTTTAILGAVVRQRRGPFSVVGALGRADVASETLEQLKPERPGIRVLCDARIHARQVLYLAAGEAAARLAAQYESFRIGVPSKGRPLHIAAVLFCTTLAGVAAGLFLAGFETGAWITVAWLTCAWITCARIRGTRIVARATGDSATRVRLLRAVAGLCVVAGARDENARRERECESKDRCTQHRQSVSRAERIALEQHPDRAR